MLITTAVLMPARTVLDESGNSIVSSLGQPTRTKDGGEVKAIAMDSNETVLVATNGIIKKVNAESESSAE